MQLAFTSACFAGLPKRLIFFFATNISLSPKRLATARCLRMFPKPLPVHGCALAYFRGNLTDYAHAWTGMNYLPQAPQSSALPSCATARRPISTGQENVTGQPPGVPSGISLQRHPHTVASPTDSRSAWGRRLAIATRRLRSRLRSRCGGGVPISNTGDESDNPND